MEIKKTPRADLEKDKSLNFLMGLVIALAILFVGFEWGEREIEVATDSGISAVIDEEEIEATVQNDPPPPPPEPEVIKTPEIITIVEDNVQVEETALLTSEDDATHAQTETYVAPVEEEEEVIDDNFVFVTVEKMPEFPGGEVALLKWISDHVNYPTIAAENGIQGRVACTFVVNADGSVTDVQVVRPVDPNLDKEAIRVLKQLPKFKPGEQRGKPVRVKYSVPVRFRLQQ
ncbi:MAG: energy transducer TonB [Tannerella sp.]|jgi:protein TonB|nr:energy transducer TonB [Tannerella sp.]